MCPVKYWDELGKEERRAGSSPAAARFPLGAAVPLPEGCEVTGPSSSTFFVAPPPFLFLSRPGKVFFSHFQSGNHM
mgnify:CR=1 FL=1